MFSLDESVFTPGSQAQVRQLDYGRELGRLHLVVRTKPGREPRQIGDNVWLHPTNTASIPSYLIRAVAIGRRLVREHDLDLVTAQDPLESGLAAWWVARGGRVALHLAEIADLFGSGRATFLAEHRLNRPRLALAGRLLRSADAVRVMNTKSRRALVERLGVDPSRITVTPWMFDLDKYDHPAELRPIRADLPQGARVIITVARLVPQKNLSLLVEAFSDLASAHPEAHLVIVGDGPDKPGLMALAERLAPAGRVHFEAATAQPSTVLVNGDIYALSSDYEGYAMLIAEAMASGLSVVMTDVGCAGDLARNNETALVVPRRERRALAEALDRLLIDADLRDRLAQAGLAAVGEQFDRRAIMDRYLASWGQAVANHRRKSARV